MQSAHLHDWLTEAVLQGEILSLSLFSHLSTYLQKIEQTVHKDYVFT